MKKDYKEYEDMPSRMQRNKSTKTPPRPRPRPKSSTADDITRENEKFIAGKIVNQVFKMFGDPETKKRIGKIQKEDIPNTFVNTLKKAFGYSSAKKAKGGSVRKSKTAKKFLTDKKGK
jgi:hypothetical protein